MWKKKRRESSISKPLRLPKDFPWRTLAAMTAAVEDELTPGVASRVAYFIRRRDLRSMKELSDKLVVQCTPSASPTQVFWNRQILRLIVKYQFQADEDTLTRESLDKFGRAENDCRKANRSLRGADHFACATRFARAVLGSLNPFVDDGILDGCRHGPGTSIGCTSGMVSAYSKYVNWPYTVTSHGVSASKRMILNNERWIGGLEASYRERFDIPAWAVLNWETFWSRVFKIVPGNKIITVPKDAFSRRPIAIEPTLNQMLQLGVDSYVRRRLKRFGVDLDDQSKNQSLSRNGATPKSFDRFATIDLSSASDTISLRIAKLILPPAWYHYLLELRSPVGDVGGKPIRYLKLSSMGNGYTFAIESLLFSAIAYQAMHEAREPWDHGRVAIYGDDIIVPQHVAARTCDLLRLAGFTVNREKSFLKGPFRESCGKEWFNGFDVTPIYIRHEPVDVRDLFHIHNSILRLGIERGKVTELLDLLALIKSWIPTDLQIYGPLSSDCTDAWIHNWVEWLPGKQPSHHRAVVFVPRRRPKKDFWLGRLCHDLRSCVSEDGTRFVNPIRGRGRLRVKWRNYDSSDATYTPCSPRVRPHEIVRFGPRGSRVFG